MSKTPEKSEKPYLEEDEYFCQDLISKPRPGIGTVLVTGASGYIGGRLTPELLKRGYRVRIMVRAPFPEYQKWWPDAEVIVGDVLDRNSLEAALEGVHTAYYLIHSLVRGPEAFEEADLRAASNFRKAADKKRLQRIIYLGGLGALQEHLSHHLRSRLAVAHELTRGRVPVTMLRAAIILGSGSASYEILFHLVKNLPVIFIPVWARNKCQPIAIRDVIRYLVGVLETPETTGLSFDIGGKDVLTYEAMLRTLAEILQKKRLFLFSPLSFIDFYSYFASLITPVPAPITLCLMEGLKSDAICEDIEIKKFIPFEPLPYREAMVLAMTREEQDKVSTRWSDAYPPAHELAIKLRELKEQPRYMSSYSRISGNDKSLLFNALCRIGGKEGWFHNNWMWRLRGVIDRIFFGVGTARGRRSRSNLKINDVIDFWRVEDLQQNKRLLLRAEMRLPGKAWLEFVLEEEEEKNRLSITAYFDTRSFLGKLYWNLMIPFHHYLFKNLLKQIDKRCLKKQTEA